MDPLVVAGHVGEGVDRLLGDLVPSEVPSSSPSARLSSSRPLIVRMAADPILRGDAAAPVARRHPAPALPRVLRAARTRSPTTTAAPVNALLGSVNQLLWCVEQVRAARGRSAASARRRRTTAPSSTRPTTPHRPPMPDALADQWERAPALYEALGWTVTASADARGRRPDGRLRRRRRSPPAARALILTGDRDMFQCAGDGRDRPAPARAPGGAGRDGRRRGRGALRRPARAPCRTSSRCAATRRTGCPARRGSARRPRPSCCAATARSRPRSPARCARSRRSGAR